MTERRRNLDMKVSDIDNLLMVLKDLAGTSKEFVLLAKSEGALTPQLLKQAIELHNLYVAVRKANKKVEVAELEELFELEAPAV